MPSSMISETTGSTLTNSSSVIGSGADGVLAGFASDQCPEGFVSVAKSTLRILTLERLGETFNQQTAVLRYTPRKFVIHPDLRVIIVAEADHGAVPLAQREDLPGPMNIENGAIQEPGFRVSASNTWWDHTTIWCVADLTRKHSAMPLCAGAAIRGMLPLASTKE